MSHISLCRCTVLPVELVQLQVPPETVFACGDVFLYSISFNGFTVFYLLQMLQFLRARIALCLPGWALHSLKQSIDVRHPNSRAASSERSLHEFAVLKPFLSLTTPLRQHVLWNASAKPSVNRMKLRRNANLRIMNFSTKVLKWQREMS